MKNKAAVITFYLIIFVLIFSGCSDPFTSVEEQPSVLTGIGFFVLEVDEEQRIIRPEPKHSDFALFRFVFTPLEETGGKPESFDRNSENLTSALPLPIGQYNLFVYAFTKIGDPDHAMLGRYLENGGVVVINDGDKTSGRIELADPVISGGQGTFSWDYKHASSADFESFSMTITPLQGGTGVTKTSPKDSDTFNAGYYWVVATMTNKAGQTAVKSEVLHIYRNLTSLSDHTFNANNFFAVFTGAVEINMKDDDEQDGVGVIGEIMSIGITGADEKDLIMTWSKDGIISASFKDHVITEPGAYSVTIRRPGYNGSHTDSINVDIFKGDGDGRNPYEIKNAVQLAYLAAQVNAGNTAFNSKDYELQNDISLKAYSDGEGWIPIGTAVNPFSGTFDGYRKKIKKLFINRQADNQGLFGVIDGGKVDSLYLEIDDGITGSQNTGGITGIIRNGGSIDLCYVSGTGSISGTSSVGGIAGTIEETEINRSCTLVNVSGTGNNIGGIIGRFLGSGSSVKNSFSAGNITGNDSIGGISGYISGNNEITNCYTTGNIRGRDDIGGITGYHYNGTVQYCYATGIISGNNRVGGIAGARGTGILANNVALNPAITSVETTVGRITSSIQNGNNKARNDMLVNDIAVAGEQDPTSPHGENIIVGENTYLTGVFTGWNTSFSWTIPPTASLLINGPLPTLQGIPAEMQNQRLPAIPQEARIDSTGFEGTLFDAINDPGISEDPDNPTVITILRNIPNARSPDNNILTTSPYVIPDNKHIRLVAATGNNVTITLADDINAALFTVLSNPTNIPKSLTLGEATGGIITLSGNDAPAQIYRRGVRIFGANATFTMNSTAVVRDFNNNNNQSNHLSQLSLTGGGAGVNLNGGTFNLRGGSILNNRVTAPTPDGYTAHLIGGGVFQRSGTFNMYDGLIQGNSADNAGGGVGINNVGTQTFNMYGGYIQGNTSAISGGGVFLAGTFNMHGGFIQGNNASQNGGGVLLSGTFNMHGGFIQGNSAGNGGGGIFYQQGSFIMSGGTIAGINATEPLIPNTAPTNAAFQRSSAGNSPNGAYEGKYADIYGTSFPGSTDFTIPFVVRTLEVTGTVELSPINPTATVAIYISGVNVNVTNNPPQGVTYDSVSKTFTYNGTSSFSNPNITITFNATEPGCFYKAQTLNIKVFDGHVDYNPAAAGTHDRRIPVNQANVAAFNDYAISSSGFFKHYKQTEPITLDPPTAGGSNWTAIGTDETVHSSFTGSYDGGGFNIYNLTINSTDASKPQGMFGVISNGYYSSGASIRNVRLIGGSITGAGTAGGIAGLVKFLPQTHAMFQAANKTSIENCYTTVNVKGNTAGGIAGRLDTNHAVIRNCYTTGNIEGDSAGGIVGYSLGAVENCYAAGTVTAAVNGGGIAGEGGDGAIVRNSIALNQSVSGGTSRHRVIGNQAGAVLLRNYARNDMGIVTNGEHNLPGGQSITFPPAENWWTSTTWDKSNHIIGSTDIFHTGEDWCFQNIWIMGTVNIGGTNYTLPVLRGP
ncbi:MAG: hypothetical protein FWD40_08985 [Treponema sp.]|nr:hypothetical protein [Treponema sp.]